MRHRPGRRHRPRPPGGRSRRRWSQVRAHQDRGRHRRAPPRRGNPRALARLENAAGGGAFAGRTAPGTHTYESQPLDPVFTKQDGGLVARQQIDKLLRRAAEKVGIDATRLGTHVGRRTVVTALYSSRCSAPDNAGRPTHRFCDSEGSGQFSCCSPRSFVMRAIRSSGIGLPSGNFAVEAPDRYGSSCAS